MIQKTLRSSRKVRITIGEEFNQLSSLPYIQLDLFGKGINKMAKIKEEEYKFAETLKPAAVKAPITVKVKGDKEISTQYGVKRVLLFDHEEKEKQVFLNAFSMENLVKGYGDETNDWVGKDVIIAVETSERTQGKASIVVTTPKKK